MRTIVIFLVVPFFAVAALEFSDPMLCCDSLSEWWSGQTGAIGAHGELYAAWRHTDLGSGDGGIYFARSLDTNRTWSRNITIHYWDPSWIHADYWDPKLFAVGDTVYCIYAVRPEHSYLNYHCYCSRSDDRGGSWNVFETSISGPFSGILSGHDFCATGTGVVHLVFSTAPSYLERFRLYYCRSTDGGVTFSPPALIPGDTINTSYTEPSLTLLNNGTLLVAAKQYGTTPSIIIFRSTNNGVSWDTIDLTYLGPVGGILLLKEGRWGRLHLMFENQNDALLSTHSDDNGQIWSNPFAITDGNFSYGFAINERRLFACWNDPNNWVPYFRLSEDNGETWSEVSRIWTGDPFAGDWLAYDVNIKDGLIALTMHNEPGHQGEGTWCAVAEWQVPIGEPASSSNRNLQVLARPNPFTRRVSLTFSQEFNKKMVTIYDPTGRMVRRLMINDGKAEWDGTAETGTHLARGVYLARVSGLPPLQLVLGE
ncbi:MAG: exo-alpha-sialidase [bacterium]